METLEALQHQLVTIDGVGSVVRTMKGLAASRIRHSELAVHALRDYTHTVELGLQVLLRERPDLPAAEGPHGRTATVVFGSDQGLCGPFNRAIADHAATWIADAVPWSERVVIAVGHRVATELDAVGQTVDVQVGMPATVEGTTPAVRDLLVRIDDWRRHHDVARVVLVHHEPRSRTASEPRTTTVVPLDASRLDHLRDRPWSAKGLPVRFGAWDDVFRALVRQYVFVSLFRAFAASLASENAARLVAMQAAERTIDERAQALEQRYHQRRQEAITEELLDVIAGWEAMEAF